LRSVEQFPMPDIVYGNTKHCFMALQKLALNTNSKDTPHMTTNIYYPIIFTAQQTRRASLHLALTPSLTTSQILVYP